MAPVGGELDLPAGPMTRASVTPSARYVAQPTAVLGSQHTGTHLAVGAGSTLATKTGAHHTLLSLGGANKTGCSSPPLSPTTTPTTYSFGPLSPHSFNSSVQTPPATVTSFNHSRESSLDAGGTINARARRDVAKCRAHNRSASSLDLCLRFRHQRAGSRDWDDLTQNMSRLLAVQSSPHEFEPLEEYVDEDLLKYRQEDQPTARPLVDTVSMKDPTPEEPPETAPSPDRDSLGGTQDNDTLPCSEDKDAQDLATIPDGERRDQVDRLTNTILDQEFGLQLGSAVPPEDVVESVRQCLAEISLSLQRAQGMGVLAATADIPVSQATGAASSTAGPGSLESSWPQGNSPGNGRKRSAQDDEGKEDDKQEDDGGSGSGEGGDISGYSDAGHRKKPKLEQYPCPFRKRSPHRFNCREWEYCAKAPFKSITELKKHILKYHQQQQFTYKCIRCHAGFTKVGDLENHMRAPTASMCNVRPGPPPSLYDDERITAAMGSQLRSRANHYNWTALWKALFPRDVSVPEPTFEPIIELHEVDHEFQSSLVAFQLQLHSTLDALLSGWSPPQGRHSAAQLRHVVDGTLENLFQDFVATTFRNVRDKVTAAASESRRPQEVVYDNINNTPSPAAAPPSPSADPRGVAAALPTPARPKPRAILPHPASTSQQRPSNSSSSGRSPVSSSSFSARYSLISSTASGSSRLRDSITAESVTSMSTSADSSYSSSMTTSHLPHLHPQPTSTLTTQSYPHQSRFEQPATPSAPTTTTGQFVIATRQPKQQPAAAATSLLLNDFSDNNNNNSQRDSGIVPDMVVDMLDGEDCTRCFGNFLNLGPCQCPLDDITNPADLDDGGVWGSF